MHLFDRINRIQLFVWGAIALLALLFADPRLALLPLAILVVLPLVQVVSGRVARSMYDPSGSTVASKPSYSGPESLAVRGRFEDAVNAYAAAARDEPGDPQPWLRIARIERADLKRPRRAIEALHAARERAAPDSQTAQMIGREIAELYLFDLAEPARAMPELARIAATFPHTPTGQWAARELAYLKTRMHEAPGSPGDPGA